jgi:hypothetical protein
MFEINDEPKQNLFAKRWAKAKERLLTLGNPIKKATIEWHETCHIYDMLDFISEPTPHCRTTKPFINDGSYIIKEMKNVSD